MRQCGGSVSWWTQHAPGADVLLRLPPGGTAGDAEAAQYYLREAPPGVAEAFIMAVESTVDGILAAPTQWRIVEEPGIRRYVFRRFPFVLYYHWEARERVTVYAVMHCSRESGHWRHRIA